MPDGPKGEERNEHGKKHPNPEFRGTGSREELGDMHFSTENYSVALEYYEKELHGILTISAASADLLRIYRKISDCYRKKGLLKEAFTYLQSAQTHAEGADEIGKASIACRRGIILYEHGKIKQALREACAAYRVFRTSDEHKEVAAAQLLIANCYARIGRSDEAEQYFLDALSSYRRIDDMVGVSYVLNNLGLFHKNSCRWGRSQHFLDRALEICEELGLTQHRVRVMLNLGIVHLKKRAFSAAENAFTTARQMAERIGDDLKYTRATLMLGVTNTRTGKLTAAEKHLLEARVLAERRAYGREICLADEFLGDLMCRRGDTVGARENYTVALAGAKRFCPEGDIVAEVLGRMAHLALLTKDGQEAMAIGIRALEAAGKCGELNEAGYIERTIGLAHELLKDGITAGKMLEKSIGTFLSVNNLYEAKITEYMLGRLYFKSRNRRLLIRARKLVGDTLGYFERHEEYMDLARGHFLLARVENELHCRDECLLHMYEAQRLAEDLKERNLLRRLRRMRKRVENEVMEPSPAPASRLKISDELSYLFTGDSNLCSYLDFILRDLMKRLTAGHGFVTLCYGSENGRKVHPLARHGITEEVTVELAAWFLDRNEPGNLLITDTFHDRRAKAIRDMLPGASGPIYFHPLCKGSDVFGLLFFQSEGSTDEPPRMGATFDIVSTYAGFIGFLIHGILGEAKSSPSKESGTSENFPRILTRSEKMIRVLDLAERVAVSDSNVLLMGETGTGKGLIARAVHRLSTRHDGKYVHVNCAALPEMILESELFGHVKGSFTGAIVNKKGLLAEADGGTIFLDEIGKTSLPLQGKLLQFLDTRKVRPVGSNEMFEVDVRLIFASKVDLIELCREGKMLEDFYYRINDFPLTIPPLRERVDDIIPIAEHYLRFFRNKMEGSTLGFSEDAIALLTSHDWPGNVRELEKVVKRAIILSDGNSIITRSELAFDMTNEGSATEEPADRLQDMVRNLEKNVIAKALERNSWNRKAAAQEIGVSYPTLLKKIRDYNLHN